jgi:cytosine/uracil/thiamine/allantoin permease
MKAPSLVGWLRIACICAMVGLALMMWSLLDPRAPPVLIAMTAGQGIGTLSLVIYVMVVLRDYQKRSKAKREQGAGSDAPLSGETS